MRIDNALAWAAEQLEGGESPSIDAKVMLANILGKSQTYLFTWPDKTLDAAQKAQFEADVAKRKRGETKKKEKQCGTVKGKPQKKDKKQLRNTKNTEEQPKTKQ